MVDLLESCDSLRYFRKCIGTYGFIPMFGCFCGCWKNPEAASAVRHFQFVHMDNARYGREHGIRGSVEFRWRAGDGLFRPYGMLLNSWSEPSNHPSCFVLLFHDEMITVRGRNLESLLRKVAQFVPITIAEDDREDGKPAPEAPFVKTIERYGQRIGTGDLDAAAKASPAMLRPVG